MPSLAALWTGIGATFVLGYWMLGRAIRLNDQEIKEKHRKEAERLARSC